MAIVEDPLQPETSARMAGLDWLHLQYISARNVEAVTRSVWTRLFRMKEGKQQTTGL